MTFGQRTAALAILRASLRRTAPPKADLVEGDRIHPWSGQRWAPGALASGFAGLPFTPSARILGTILEAAEVGESVDRTKRPPTGKANGFKIEVDSSGGKDVFRLDVDGGVSG